MNMSQSTLDYLVTDFLEMHFSQDQEMLFRVKKQLFSKRIKVRELHSLPCFILERAIVVVQDGPVQEPAELLLLNAKEHSFRTFALK